MFSVSVLILLSCVHCQFILGHILDNCKCSLSTLLFLPHNLFWWSWSFTWLLWQIKWWWWWWW